MVLYLLPFCGPFVLQCSFSCPVIYAIFLKLLCVYGRTCDVKIHNCIQGTWELQRTSSYSGIYSSICCLPSFDHQNNFQVFSIQLNTIITLFLASLSPFGLFCTFSIHLDQTVLTPLFRVNAILTPFFFIFTLENIGRINSNDTDTRIHLLESPSVGQQWCT